jgi:hypothetical protein
VLGDLLAQHPDVAYLGEVYSLQLTRLRGRGRQADLPTLDLAAHLRGEMRVLRPGWAGMEYLRSDLLATQTPVPAHVQHLRDLGFTHFVLLRRENLVRQYVSLCRAQLNGVWHDRGAATPLRGPVTLPLTGRWDADSVVGRFDAIEAFYAQLRVLHREDPVLELTYEADVEIDPGVAYRKVEQFLGLAPFTPHVRLRRLNSAPLSELVANLAELRSVLRGTRYEEMIDS